MFFYYLAALTTSCQVYPSEYAYHDNSVTRVESASANCGSYPRGILPAGVHPKHYIHCVGVQLRLSDSDFGPEQYSSSDYYVWRAGTRNQQLLFIFPTRVTLTTITLHYYSDSVQGLSRLRFFAVTDDFNVWDAVYAFAISGSAIVAAVPPGREPVGRRSVSFSVNFNTKKVVMYVIRSDFQFAVSEVEFFTCNSKLVCLLYTSPSPRDATLARMPSSA